MFVLGPMAHCIAASVIIVLLLDRGTLGAEKNSKHSTSPWFPAGPPPSKPTSTTSSPEAMLQKILPKVTFDCSGKTGYFPDIKFNCEVFHYCKSDGSRTTFTCPQRSIFNQLSMVCEERTAFNVRICKEGAIGAKKKDVQKKTVKEHHHPKSTTHQTKSYKEDVAKQHRMSPTTAARTVDHAKTSFSRSLEDLLGYMNSDQQAKKTFDPNDHVQTSKTTIPSKTTRSMPFESSKIMITEKPKFSRILSNKSVERDAMQTSESRVVEDFSKEYDDIEGRRPRQHKTVGKVLDVPHKRSHVSARSPTDAPPTKTLPTTQTPTSTTETSTTSVSAPPSLFNADRSKAKGFRKRRRNRKRKNQDQNDGNATETTTVVHEVMTDTMESASNIYPQQINPENSLSWMGLSQNGEVKPYTLPPLPIPKEEHHTTAGLEPATSTKRRRTRRPSLHATTTTPLPNEDLMLEMKFGEKISELSHHQYGQNLKTKTDHPEYSDLYDFEDIATEDYTERYSTTKPKKIVASNSRQKESKKHFEKDERFFHYPLTTTSKKTSVAPEDLFPPPRAEPREQKSSDRQQHIYDKKTSFNDEEMTTTDDPSKTTFSYVGRHRSRSRGQPESKWKISEKKRKEKVEVGSIFHSESTARPRLQVPPTEEPMEDEKNEKPNGIASAQQNLLKLMNDFFAMSSAKSSTEESDDLRYMEEDMDTPNYKGSEEDMHRGESIHEDIEEIPPELLDVVDFISEQSDEDKRNSKHEDSHEIIKISGPITNKHLKEILSDNFQHRKKSRKEQENKFVFVPSEDKENMKDLAEVAQFASTRLGPLLKQMASDKTSVTLIPMKGESEKQRKPTVMSAKKIPVRVFYKEQASTPMAYRATSKPMLKVVRSQLPNPSLQIIHSGRTSPSNTYSQPHYKPKQHSVTPRPIIIHPKSMYPPHPPPLHKKAIPFGFPFAGNSRPFIHPMRYMSHRKKRSVLKRERRQLRPNPAFLPFPRPVFPTFNPKFAPNFPPFKNIFAPNGLSTAGSSHNPFHFPKFDIRKPTFGESSSIYSKLPYSPPAPVRHITQAGDQTVIVEEVPVPIHVEVSDPNLLRPVHPGNHKQNLVDPFPSNNQFRTPSPPAIQHPPLMQGFQGRFPVTNNYRPYGMPSNVRPPVMNYHGSIPFSPPLPPTITNQGHLYALGVTNKPFIPSKPPPGRSPNSVLGVPPSQHFQVHSNSYPNYPYFQGSLTTPIADGQIPGRVMFSGYKPPKTTTVTKLPRTTRMPNRERKVKPENGNRTPSSRARPSQSYYHVTNTPSQEYYNSYKEPRGRTPYGEAPQKTFGSTSPSPIYSSTSPESPIPRRRPYKKRRPRPQMTSTTSAAYISPTPPPSEQIVPPPLVDFTSLPLQHEAKNSIQNNKDSKPTESSSLYPPAGYYGKDQLVQFFDSSSKSYNKASTPKSIVHNDLGENTSSAELDETVTSFSSGEDSEQPAFGTRLNANSDGRKRKKKRQQIQSPTQKSEVRTRPSNSPDDSKRPPEYVNRKPNRNQQGRDENSNGQRRPQYRQRGRPTSMPSRKPEVHHYKYDGNTGGFYSVPSGLQTLVDPSHRPGPGSTDMFGIPHPSMDKSTYSLRPQGSGGDFNSNFFSVPSEVAKQQKSSLHVMNTRPMPDSAREFFEAAAKESSNYKNVETSENKENEEQGFPTNAGDDKKQQRNSQVVRKLRKPKRKNRYNPRNNEDKSSTSDVATSGESKSTPSQRNTTPATTTSITSEPSPTYTPTESTNSPNDIKEQVFKPRSPLLPKALPDLSQKLQNGKIDYKKLNATISTSVSVSGAFPQQQSSSENAEDTSKRVFSSQNGGLAVVKSNPKRKRTKQKLDRFGSDEESSTKTKYDIAASVLDIIKATAETEKLGGAGFYSNRYSAEPSASNKFSVWDKDPTRIDFNRTTSTR